LNALYSLFAGTLLAAVDVVALVLLVKNLGKKLNPGKAALLAFFVAGKLAFLGLAVFWMSRAPWFETSPAVAGLAFPFVILIVVYGFNNTPTNKVELKHGQ
jgi:hypothetical protein